MYFNWDLFRKRPNLRHLSETEKWRRFLLEKEEYNWKMQAAQDALASGGSGGGTQPVAVMPETTNSVVQAWLEKIRDDGYAYPSQQRVNIYTEAFDYAEQEGLLQEIDLLGLFKTELSDHIKVPFIHSAGSGARFTVVGQPVFNTSKGLRGFYIDNVIPSYVNTNWNPSRDAVQYAAADASMGAYLSDYSTAFGVFMSASELTDPNQYWDNSLSMNGNNFGVSIQVQYDIDVIAVSGAAVFPSTNTSKGFFHARYNAGIASGYLDGTLLAPTEPEIAPGNNTRSNTLIVLGDSYGDQAPQTSYEGFIQMFFAGSGALDPTKMATFVDMLLRGTPTLYITNDDKTALVSTSYSLYNNYNGTVNDNDQSATFNIFGERLAEGGAVTVSLPSDFEMYDGTTWRSGSFDISYAGRTLDNGAIYKLRMKSGLPVGIYQQSISISGGGADLISISVTGEVVTASANVAIWEDQLIGDKPSGVLIKALNTMIEGIISDGDMAEADFFMVSGGMETDEQRLLPFKTTSPDKPVLAGAAPPTGSRDGLAGTATGYINFRWIPATHAVMGSQNNFSIHASFAGTLARVFAGTEDASSVGRLRIGVNTNPAAAVNDASFSNLTGVTNGVSGTMYVAGFRTDANTKYGYRGVQGSNMATASNGFSTKEMYGLAFNNNGAPAGLASTAHLGKMWMWGSSAINPSRVRSRLNAYFTILGLATAT